MGSQTQVETPSAARRWTLMVLTIVILTFSLYGFGDKFVQFILVARGEPDGVFALTPIINYLLASFGFLCLIGWAAANGTFHDIERPKITMLENEQKLDAQEHRTNRAIQEERTR